MTQESKSGVGIGFRKGMPFGKIAESEWHEQATTSEQLNPAGSSNARYRADDARTPNAQGMFSWNIDWIEKGSHRIKIKAISVLALA